MPRRTDAGMVTAEIAMALPALVLVLGFALTMQTAVATRAACLDAARAGAREAARGEQDAVVDQVVRRALPQTTSVSIVRRAGLVSVRVAARSAAVGGRLDLPEVTAVSTALDETSR